MIEEIKTDNNCIVKAFENNPISILHEDIDNKKIYYFKASDVGKVLGIVNIHSTIQNYEEDDERVIRKAYDPQMNLQNTTFLSSQGVYRLLYNSKKEIAKKFRKWAGNILDDIIFNQSKELQKQLENQKLLLEEQKHLTKRKVEITLRNSFNKRSLVYLIKITINDEIIYKFGYTDDIVTRLRTHKNQIGEDIELVYCIESKDNKMLEKHSKSLREFALLTKNENFFIHVF
jgi:prophage antirepressor-like protein